MKRSLKRILSIILCAIMLAGIGAVDGVALNDKGLNSKTSVDGNWKYEENPDNLTISITDYNGNDAEVVIPETIDGMPVTAIESGSFNDCETLETVAIGGNVTTISDDSFSECTNLQSAYIYDNVIMIAVSAFANCQKLTIYCAEGSYAHSYANANSIPVSTFVISPIPSQTYTGQKIEPEVSVKISGIELTNGKDFKVEYSNNIDVGNAEAKIAGLGSYKMFASKANFAIITRSICETTIGKIADQAYTGEEIKPKIIITYNGKILHEGTDYSVSYKSNINIGKASATIKGKGNFSGSATFLFNIIPPENASVLSQIISLADIVWQFIVTAFTAIINLFR